MEDAIRRALLPTDIEIRSLPLSSNLAVARTLLPLGVERALDIGCGDGKFTRALTALAKNVGGIDVKANKIAEAREAAADAGASVDFKVGSGDALPYGDASFDVVAFSNSLHHMPNPRTALDEAIRVLRPDGLLYVMEPVPAGNYHEATKLVNDETVVRTDAYREILNLPSRGLKALEEIMYRGRREVASFDEWKADQIDRDAKRKALFDARPEEVRTTFESNADRSGGGFGFDQVFRVNVLQKES
jgi:SAM-dependent methyltransferase